VTKTYHRIVGTVAVFLLITALGCKKGEDAAYREAVDDWHRQRETRLRQPTGWLSLVGLESLAVGDNTVGSAPDNGIVLRTGSVPYLGTLSLTADTAEFEVVAGESVGRWQGADRPVAAFAGGVMHSDENGPPDMLISGSIIFYVIRRGDSYYLRVKDRQSPRLRDFRGIERFPVDPTWRVSATLGSSPQDLRVVNVLGQVASETSPGSLVFVLQGQSCQLIATSGENGGLFVVFGDASNGHGTYPGGRFLSLDPPETDGTYDLDFNKAYNPPCSFTPYATCPLPDEANILPLTVRAGEKSTGVDH